MSKTTTNDPIIGLIDRCVDTLTMLMHDDAEHIGKWSLSLQMLNSIRDEYEKSMTDKHPAPPNIKILDQTGETIADVIDDVNADERKGVAAWRYGDYLGRIWEAYVKEKDKLRNFHAELVRKLEEIWDKTRNSEYLRCEFGDPIKDVIDDLVSNAYHNVPEGKAEKLVREWKEYVWQNEVSKGAKTNINDIQMDINAFSRWLVKKGKVVDND